MSRELLAVSVGNTRVRLGVFRDGRLDATQALPCAAIRDAARWLLDASVASGTEVLVASVNEPAAERLIARLAGPVRDRGGTVRRLGREVPIPVRTALRDETTVGQDRLLNALAAYGRLRQACVVVDAGTAVTVDFVDGEGVFRGGVIAPGLNLMLRALHEHTAALPRIEFDPSVASSPEPFGRNTPSAMLLGVRAAVQGLVYRMVDRYAEFSGSYPMVVVTGGDAPALFEGDALVDRLVPHLTLMGIEMAWSAGLQ